MLQGAHETFGFICNKYLEHIFRFKHSMNLLFVRISFSLLDVKQPESSSKYIYKTNIYTNIYYQHISVIETLGKLQFGTETWLILPQGLCFHRSFCTKPIKMMTPEPLGPAGAVSHTLRFLPSTCKAAVMQNTSTKQH